MIPMKITPEPGRVSLRQEILGFVHNTAETADSWYPGCCKKPAQSSEEMAQM